MRHLFKLDALPGFAALFLLVLVRTNLGSKSIVGDTSGQPWRHKRSSGGVDVPANSIQQQQHDRRRHEQSGGGGMAEPWLDPHVPQQTSGTTAAGAGHPGEWSTTSIPVTPPGPSSKTATTGLPPPRSASLPPPPAANAWTTSPPPPPPPPGSAPMTPEQQLFAQQMWQQQQVWQSQFLQLQQEQNQASRQNEMTCTSEKEVCLTSNYSRFQLPNKGQQTTVSIGFDGFDVRKIDDIEYTVEISCYFLTKWKDDRLVLHDDIRSQIRGPDGEDLEEQWFPIDLEFVAKLWLPDVEVLNLKQFLALNVLSKLQGLWVSQHSNILYVLATRVTFICAMSFDAFPLDVQTCLLQVGSFNFDNRKMVFDSYLLPSMPNHTKSILDYDVHIDELRPEATFFVPAETGNYSVTGFEMTLTRRMSHYMITYYLPSSLFVVVSWTSFLIPSEDIQGRMALLVTLFLVLVNIFNTTTTNSPKADGLNAMQSWVICCIFFVFGALFEYAIILLQMKVKTFRKLAAPIQKDETCKLDMAVLIAFPIVFLIFNISYWAAFHL